MANNAPIPKVIRSTIPNSGGSVELSTKTPSGSFVKAVFSGDKEPSLLKATIFPPQPHFEGFYPKGLSIRPSTEQNQVLNGVDRENGSSLSPDEFKAINEAVQAFGGVAHKFGDALREVLGKTSGKEVTFSDLQPLRAPTRTRLYDDNIPTTTTSTIPTTTTTTTTTMTPMIGDR